MRKHRCIVANIDFIQAAFLSNFFLIGILFFRAFQHQNPLPLIIIFSSFPLGCGMVAVLVTIHVMTSLSYPITFDLIFANLTAIGFAYKKNKSLKKNLNQILISTALFFFVSSLATTIFPYISLSYDSIRQILFAYKLGLTGNGDGIDWPNWGPIFLAIHSLAPIINENYLSTFLISFVFCFLGTFFLSIYNAPNNREKFNFEALFWAFLATAFLGGTRFFWINTIYIHNNIVSAVFLFFAMVFLIEYEKQKFKYFINGYLCFLIIFSLSRPENFIVSALFIQATIFIDDFLSRKEKNYIWFALVPSFMWHLWIMIDISSDGTMGSILDTTTVLGQLLLTLFIIILNTCKFSQPVAHMLKKLFIRIPEIILILLLFFSFYPGTNLYLSMQSILANSFAGKGDYQSGWYVLAIFIPFISFRKKADIWQSLVAFIFSYYFLIILLSIFRMPFRIGLTDSSNRIFLTHFILLLYLFVVMLMRNVLLFGFWEKVYAWIVVLCIVVIGAYAAGKIYFTSNRNRDFMELCEEITGEGFLPWKSLNNIRELKEITPYKFERFAQADSGGMRDVVFRFPKSLTASKLVMENVVLSDGRIFGLTDFSWEWSQDGEKWTEFYSRSEGIDKALPVIREINLPEFNFKFLRLKGLRSNAWEKRFILKRVSIYR